jgi:hypothetical protein
MQPAVNLQEPTPPSSTIHCPCCGYDLSGLPADHRCPECGFGYQHRAVENLALGYADAKQRAYSRVARLCAAAAALNLVAVAPPTVMPGSAACLLFVVPVAALALTAYWARDLRGVISTFPRVVVVVLVLALRGLVPNIVPAILLAAGTLLLALATFEHTAQARRYPYAKLSLEEEWLHELKRYRKGAWAGIVAGFSSLMPTVV